MSRPTHRAATAGLAVLATLGALLCAEAAVRLWAPVPRPIYVLHERYLYGMAPHARQRSRPRVPEHEAVWIETNALGYRGAGPDPAADLRVAVYGDSFVHADFSPEAETFVARLEARLRRGGAAGVQVLNAGVPGYGPDQNALRIEDELDVIRPHAVVLVVFTGNDFGDLLRNKLFRLEGGELVENHPVLDDDVRLLYREKEERFGADTGLGRSMLVRLLRKARYDRLERDLRPVWDEEEDSAELDAAVLGRLLRAREREYRRFVLEGDNEMRLELDTYDADMAFRPDGASARHKAAAMAAVIRRVRDTLSARGIPLLLVVVPSPIDACREHRPLEDGLEAIHRPSAPSDAVVAASRALEIPHVDLFPEFRGPGCKKLYYPHPDNHWNAAGQDRAAALAAERLGDVVQAGGSKGSRGERGGSA